MEYNLFSVAPLSLKFVLIILIVLRRYVTVPDLIVLMIPVINGIQFAYWTWWIARHLNGDNGKLHLPAFIFRIIISICPIFLLIFWLFTENDSIKMIETTFMIFCCISYFVFGVRDRYAQRSDQLSPAQRDRLDWLTIGLIVVDWFNLFLLLMLYFSFIGVGQWLSERSVLFVIGMLILLAVMYGIVALAIKRGKARAEQENRG